MRERKIPVRAGIHTLTAYSAHADQRMLVDWVQFIIYIDDPLTLQSCHPSGHLVLPALVCYTWSTDRIQFQSTMPIIWEE
jgi:hypothetical protein